MSGKVPARRWWCRRREGQVYREVYLSKVLLQGGGGAGEGRDRGAGGGRDGPWATQGMSMGYAYKEIVGYG